jgi:hypothetical protein
VNNNWSHFNEETCRILIGMFDSNKDGTIDVREFEALWKYVQEWRNCFERYAHASMHAYRYIHTCTRAAFRGRGHFPAELSLAPLAHPFAC